MPRNRVLLIDTDPTVREAAAARLRAAGYEVLPAWTFQQFHEALAEWEPGAVVIEPVLEGIDGFELSRAILASYSARPEIIIASNKLRGSAPRNKAQQVGARLFLEGPLDGPEVVDAVQAALSGEREDVFPAPAPRSSAAADELARLRLPAEPRAEEDLSELPFVEQPVASAPVEPARTTAKPERRRVAPLRVALVLGVLGGGAALAMWLFRGEAAAPEIEAVPASVPVPASTAAGDVVPSIVDLGMTFDVPALDVDPAPVSTPQQPMPALPRRDSVPAPGTASPPPASRARPAPQKAAAQPEPARARTPEPRPSPPEPATVAAPTPAAVDPPRGSAAVEPAAEKPAAVEPAAVEPAAAEPAAAEPAAAEPPAVEPEPVEVAAESPAPVAEPVPAVVKPAPDPWPAVVVTAPREPVTETVPIVAAVPVSRVEPRYPPIAHRHGVSGKVVLKAVVRTDGTVGAIEVLEESAPRWRFGQAAKEAVGRWRYEPARQGGRPVESSVVIQLVFDPH